MMKMGVWYETALCQSNNGRKNIFANNVDMPFKHGKYFRCVIPVFTELTGKIFFFQIFTCIIHFLLFLLNTVQLHQCANPSLTKWIWGQNMWDIIKDRSDKANMTDHVTSYDTVGFHPLQEIPADRIECFEDLYLSARMGLWMQGIYKGLHILS